MDFEFILVCVTIKPLIAFKNKKMKSKSNPSKVLFSKLFSVFFLFSFLLSPVSLFADEASTASTSSGIQTVATGFSDVPRTHPYYVAITFLNQSGVIGGYSDGTFKPGNPINRAEVLKIILGGSGISGATEFRQDFPDVGQNDWFAPYVLKGKELGFVKGNDSDGTFAPGRQVNLAEFIKMLLEANEIDVSAFDGKVVIPNIPADAWYAPYINYAATLGIILKDANGNIDAGKALTRGEVVNIMYLLTVIRRGQDTQFLLTRAEAEMAQIEVYIAANQVVLAKMASELSVDLTQQAYKNMPDNNVVLGAAKIARAYDYLVDAFVLGVQKKNDESAARANDAIDKATEAWEANNATQSIARHIKERAREILAQLGAEEK